MRYKEFHTPIKFLIFFTFTQNLLNERKFVTMITIPKFLRNSHIFATYALIALGTITFLVVAVPRFLYPYELLWMEGSILDQLWRVMANKPLYCKPSIEYVPWLYQPFYYYLTSAFTSITGLTFVTARIPSVLSSIAICAIVFKVVKKETKSLHYSIVGVGLFIGAYGKIGYCLEAARVDTLFAALLLISIITIYYCKSRSGLLIGILALILSYFTKQTALVFAPAIALYLIAARSWKISLLFCVAFSALIIIGTYSLDSLYNGWYHYYALLIPQAKRKTLRWDFAIDGFIMYILLRCWLATTLLSIPALRYFIKGFRKKEENFIGYIALFFLSGLGAGFAGILNEGGAHNVLLPAAIGCAIFLPVAVNQLSINKRYATPAKWLIPIQLLFLLSNPFNDPRNLAKESDRLHQEEFLASISPLQGEVWVPYHGFMPRKIGKQTYAELRAFGDVLLIGDSNAHQLQSDLDSALSNKKWSYIFDDFQDTFPGYRLIEQKLNLNKPHVSDETTIFVFVPQK